MKRLIFLIGIFYCLNLQAQEYTVRHFTVQDGLPSGLVTRIFQDSRGFLWFGSDAGLSRYDGRHFVNYGIDDGLLLNYITDIKEDKKGHLWICNNYNVSEFDGNKFNNHILRYKGRTIETRRCMPLDDGRVLVTSRYGMYLIDGDSLYRYSEEDGLPNNNCYSICKTTDNRILIASRGGITEWLDGKFKLILEEESNTAVFSILQGPDGFIWYGMLHNVVARFDLKNPKSSRQEIEVPERSTAFIAAFLAKDDQYMYLGGDKKFYRFKNGKYVGSSPRFLKIGADVVNEIYSDREGNVWAGSQYGLWRLSQGFSTHLTDTVIRAQSIYSVRVLKEDSVLFTDGFFYYTCSNGKIKEVLKDRPVQGSENDDFIIGKDKYIYFGSSLTGLLCRTPKGEYKDVELKKGIFKRCFKFAHHPDGYELMGSNHYLYKLSGGVASAYDLPELMGQNVLFVTANPKGKIWIGTSDDFFSLEKGKLRSFGRLIDSQGIVVESIVCDKDLLYVGTKGHGIHVFRERDDSLTLLKKIDVNEGLPSNYICALQLDKKGQLWAASKRGLSKIVDCLGEQTFVRTYTSEDGIPNTFWDKSLFDISAEGIIWVGTADGLVKIAPEREFTSNFKPKVYLLDVQASHGEFKFSPRRLIPPVFTKPISYSNNDFTFYFTSLQLSNAENVQFLYKLEGRSQTWMQAPSNGLLTLNNLYPGKYKLWIKSFDPNRQLYSNEVSYSFEIERPFWMSGWFYFLLFIVLVAIIYALFRWRINVNYRKQQEKMLVNRQLSESRYLAFQARMNPHFIFNSLNSIQYFITKNDKKSSLTYLSKFARLLRQILDNSKALKIPLKEEIEILTSYVEMESMRFDYHFSYEFHIHPSLDLNNIEIPGMILQPFVENAIVHGLLHKKSGEGILRVSMEQEDTYIHCVIEDNGVGRLKSAEINSARKANHKSYGMEIASNRLMLLAEDRPLEELIQIEDLAEPIGTRVTIKLPIV